ncbi:MAG: alpha/beta fold hydrolase [Propionibacteriaceae bacterium]|nr:alpha/beta fold hydrolase [Propionibacteriaceae bacterium]
MARILHSRDVVVACVLTVVLVVSVVAVFMSASTVASLLFLVIGILAFTGLGMIARRRLSRGRAPIAVVVALVDLVACGAVLIGVMADSALFHPNQNQSAYQILVADPTMEQVRIAHGHDTYTGWFVHNTDGTAPLVIGFLGNGECAASRVERDESAGLWPTYAGYNYMVIDYPGYGTSSGHPSQDSIFSMAVAAYDYAVARADVDPTRVVVEGYSLGTGPATYLASQRDVAGLVLIAPYDSGVSLYNSQVNIFHGPLTLLVGFRADSKTYAESVRVAPLIVTSTADTLIDHTLSEHLATHFPIAAHLHVLSGLTHNQYLTDPEVLDLIHGYLQDVAM